MGYRSVGGRCCHCAASGPAHGLDREGVSARGDAMTTCSKCGRPKGGAIGAPRIGKCCGTGSEGCLSVQLAAMTARAEGAEREVERLKRELGRFREEEDFRQECDDALHDLHADMEASHD